jgi:hypothetical protein
MNATTTAKINRQDAKTAKKDESRNRGCTRINADIAVG